MDSLIARLESATEGSLELDYDIHQALGWQDNDECGWSRGDERTDPNWPYYTTSFDAALTLVPEGHCITLRTCTSIPQVIVHCPVESRLGNHYGKAATPALAICCAALKARL